MSLSSISTVAQKERDLDYSNLKKIFFELTKIRITFFVAVTTFVGYILAKGSIELDFILPVLGVFILASGASVLNEYQERFTDAIMARTKQRPIPSGKILPETGIIIALSLISFGSLALSFVSPLVLALGLFTLVWYNLVYTPLKKITSLAIIPGSLVGALPPIIGWVAITRNFNNPIILLVVAFIFLWQIPHFWILLLMYDEQYKSAGFPTLTSSFTKKQLALIAYGLIVVLVLMSAGFYFVGLTSSILSKFIMVASGILTLYFSKNVVTKSDKKNYKNSFLIINVYVLIVLLTISVESII